MVVDDVVENRTVLGRMLEMIGADVVTVTCGEDALRRASAEVFNVVFLDVLMPGMDGFEAVARLRKLEAGPGLRVVATSAAVLAHERKRYDAAGFDDVLAKPISVKALNECLRRVAGVEFVFDAAPDGSASRRWSHQTAMAEAASLPDLVAGRLREACNLSSVTGARECAGELERLGLAGGHLARCLRECLQTFDLTPIGEIMGDTAPALNVAGRA
jgi:CheY-like chemotaxis protein